ncbi:hypothetical protein BKA70DRAFT_1236537 [Coprinopsis sp. MPI-PUGE-AT-0042]|nr:hypothetical protein BKA70DRAFT_1236537 [Coprinopsis sp. MPI-PUGE-AT-0042]
MSRLIASLVLLASRKFILDAGDQITWRVPGSPASSDCLILVADLEGYPNRSAAMRARSLPAPLLSLDDLGLARGRDEPAKYERPGPIVENGKEEYQVDRIVDEDWNKEDGVESDKWYRIRWKGWPPQDDTWIPAVDADYLEALDKWSGQSG